MTALWYFQVVDFNLAELWFVVRIIRCYPDHELPTSTKFFQYILGDIYTGFNRAAMDLRVLGVEGYVELGSYVDELPWDDDKDDVIEKVECLAEFEFCANPETRQRITEAGRCYVEPCSTHQLLQGLYKVHIKEEKYLLPGKFVRGSEQDTAAYSGPGRDLDYSDVFEEKKLIDSELFITPGVLIDGVAKAREAREHLGSNVSLVAKGLENLNSHDLELFLELNALVRCNVCRETLECNCAHDPSKVAQVGVRPGVLHFDPLFAEFEIKRYLAHNFCDLIDECVDQLWDEQDRSSDAAKEAINCLSNVLSIVDPTREERTPVELKVEKFLHFLLEEKKNQQELEQGEDEKSEQQPTFQSLLKKAGFE